MIRWQLAVLVLSSGCAFGRAMREGETLAAAGDWAGAFGSYSAAVEEKPNHAEAKQARDEARERAVEEALTRASQSMDIGEYEAAKKALEEVEAIDSDRPDLFQMHRELELAMTARFDALWQNREAVEAYAFAVRMRKLLPKAERAEEQVGRARQFFLVEATAQTTANQHERALAVLAVVTENEPDRKPEIDAVERSIRLAWADFLVTNAAKFVTEKRIGFAAVTYARAYAIAGRQPDLTQAQTLARSLAEQGRFSIKLQVAGDAARVEPVQKALLTGLAGVKDAVLVETGDPAFGLRITLARGRCSETDTVTKATLDYISGQVERPNPVWVELAGKFNAARDRWIDANGRSERLWPKVAAADVERQKAAAGIAAVQKIAGDIDAALATTTTQRAAAQQSLDGLGAQREALVAQGATDLSTIDAAFAKTKDVVAQWAAKFAQEEQAQGMAAKKLAEITGRAEAANATFDKVRAEYDAIIGERTAAETELTALKATMSQTTQTNWEDVPATLKYDVHDWKRTCVAPTTLAPKARWKTTLVSARTIEPAAGIADRSYAGHEKARLAADPKSYSTSDAALVARADEETVKAVLEWTSGLADDAYRDWIGTALTAIRDAPVDAATWVLALKLGAPGRLDEATAAAFDRYLKEQCKLEKPELLTAN